MIIRRISGIVKRGAAESTAMGAKKYQADGRGDGVAARALSGRGRQHSQQYGCLSFHGPPFNGFSCGTAHPFYTRVCF